MANYCGRASVHVATISGHCIIMHHFVCMLVVSLNTVYAKTVIYTCTDVRMQVFVLTFM